MKLTKNTLYKILGKNGKPCNGGAGKWFLPKGNRPGKWMPAIGQLVPCSSGYHLCRQKDLIIWLGPTIWIAEAKGKQITCETKLVVQQARLIRQLKTWNERTARLFACDCAKHVLKYCERYCSTDKRPREAIEIARKFAKGEATGEELAAAWAAAWDTAEAASAWDTARGAAWAAARGAERKWQARKLMQYLKGDCK